MSIAFLIANDRSHTGCILKTSQGPEVIPVSMYRTGGIALVADRFRHDPIKWLFLGSFEGLAQTLLAQGINVLNGFDCLGPHLIKQTHVPSVAVVLHQQVDKFAMAIVLRHWIR